MEATCCIPGKRHALSTAGKGSKVEMERINENCYFPHSPWITGGKKQNIRLKSTVDTESANKPREEPLSQFPLSGPKPWFQQKFSDLHSLLRDKAHIDEKWDVQPTPTSGGQRITCCVIAFSTARKQVSFTSKEKGIQIKELILTCTPKCQAPSNSFKKATHLIGTKYYCYHPHYTDRGSEAQRG